METNELEGLFNETEIKEMFEYLDDLRESGLTNMYGAGRWLEDEFELPKYQARQVLKAWMDSFSERHPNA